MSSVILLLHYIPETEIDVCFYSLLQQMKSELEQKRDLLTKTESALAKAIQTNGQISESFHKCDVDLSKYSELVGQLSDRWRRIQTQIDSRYGQDACKHISSCLNICSRPPFIIAGNNTKNILSTPSTSFFPPQSVGLGETGETAETLSAEQHFPGTVDRQCQEAPGHTSDG